MKHNTIVFWNLLDRLVDEHHIVIDRPSGTLHPQYLDYIYPLDYGYLEGTVSSDCKGIDIWVGTDNNKCVTAIIASIDILKSDSEIKILYGCSNDEVDLIFLQHNRNDNMKGLLVKRYEI